MKVFGAPARDVLSGVVFLVVIALVGGLIVAYQSGTFASGVRVTAVLPQSGSALDPGAAVQFRRVQVGTVTAIDARPGRAVLSLRLDPGRVDALPADARVRILPRNLFGTEYVDLVPPPQPTAAHLRSGDVLQADSSAAGVSIQRALTSAYDVLSAIHPAQVQTALAAIAQALDGRGQQVGELLRNADAYLAGLQPHTATLTHDVAQLASLSDELATDAPDLLRVLADAVVTSRTIVSHRQDLAALLGNGTALAGTARDVLAANGQRLTELMHVLAPVGGVLDSYRGELPATVRNLQALLLNGAKALDDGPYLNSDIRVDTTSLVPYSAADCPVYPPDQRGPNCPAGSS